MLQFVIHCPEIVAGLHIAVPLCLSHVLKVDLLLNFIADYSTENRKACGC
jgi:hypothetical protein